MAIRKIDEGQILIKSPITSNGRDLVMGEDGRIQYKETIAMAAARAGIERINTKLPSALKHIIEDIKPEKPAAEKPKTDDKK